MEYEGPLICYKNLPPGPILSHINPIHTILPYFCMVLFNILLPPTTMLFYYIYIYRSCSSFRNIGHSPHTFIWPYSVRPFWLGSKLARWIWLHLKLSVAGVGWAASSSGTLWVPVKGGTLNVSLWPSKCVPQPFPLASLDLQFCRFLLGYLP
jgi:hypothetical protein